jgi:hypothetical protein
MSLAPGSKGRKEKGGRITHLGSTAWFYHHGFGNTGQAQFTFGEEAPGGMGLDPPP